VLTKALPSHLRISILPLGPSERLHFVPQGESESLRQILGRCQMLDPNMAGDRSLRDMFEFKLGDSLVTSPYADLLPERPRQLDHLWRQLRDVVHHEPKARVATRIAEHLVRIAIESAVEAAPDVPRDTIRIFESDVQGTSVEFNYSQLEARRTVGAGRTVHRTDSNAIVMRRIDGLPLQIAISESEKQVTPTSGLPAGFTMAHYFAADLADPEGSTKAPFFLWGSTGSLALPGGINWEGSLDVEYKQRRTDSRFAVVPDWDAKYDYYLYIAGWNACWNVVKDFGPDPSRSLLEWATVKHLSLVAAVQEKRAIPTEFMDSLRDEMKAMTEGWSPQEELDSFADTVARLYKTEGTRTIREADFVNWVDVHLPALADPLLDLESLGQRILEMRRGVLTDRGVLESANRRCAEYLALRVQRHISADWTTSTISLIEKFEPKIARRLEELHEVARDEVDSDLRALTIALERRGVPKAVVGELFLSGVTPELQKQLRLAGLPEPAIETLAERFSPLEGKREVAQHDDSRG
jgi:hypothetical protein